MELCHVLVVVLVAIAAVRAADPVVVWSDEFNEAAGTQLDESKWYYHVGDGTGQGLPGWGNQELEYYTSDPVNVQMDGQGNLVLTATNVGASAYSCYYGACQYTSGRIFTGCKFTHAYGRIESRLKTPAGQGLWPGYWMLGDTYDNLGWPDSGEMDIMELHGSNPNSISGTIHGPGYSGAGGLTHPYNLPNGGSFADDFHVIAIEWSPDNVTWTVDGVAYATNTPDDLGGKEWVFNHPFYVLYSFAVGGSFDGNPGPTTVFPAQFVIDYVRVYDYGTTAAEPKPEPLRRQSPEAVRNQVAVNRRESSSADPPVVWSDEFNDEAGTQPDPTYWGYQIGDGSGHGLPGWGNQELEYYTSDAVNAQTDGEGNLVITATNVGANAYGCYYGACQYTSARLFTGCKFTYEYGRFEARMKLPAGKGVWPGFWMLGDNYDSLGWPNSGELDIMEMHGSDPTYISGTIHGPGYSGNEGKTHTYTLPDGATFDQDYHIFAVEWEPNTITWTVDGTPYATNTPADLGGDPWVFDHPFYFLFTLAIGGNFDGNPDGTTVFPAQILVDYVRVYSNGTAPPTPTTTTSDGSKTTATTTPSTKTTTTGSSGGNRDAYKNIEAESADEQSGTTTEPCSDTGAGQDVAGISDGDYLVFKNVDFGDVGPTTVEIRYASGATAGEVGDVYFHLDSADGPYFGQFGMGTTGGDQKWLSEIGSISPPPTGVHDLYLTFISAATDDFASLNWVLFNH